MNFIEIACLCAAMFINIAVMQHTIAVFREKQNKLLELFNNRPILPAQKIRKNVRKDNFGFVMEVRHYGGKI